jgi:hypothetical protein
MLSAPNSSAGDVNGDGLDDLIVGAKDADPSGKLSAGKSYVVFNAMVLDFVPLGKMFCLMNTTLSLRW